ncbi:MAG: hypothetical protein K0S79_945, partial [Nitrospira sp.]|nr:hypothetical protein [Nitrospira sp.]
MIKFLSDQRRADDLGLGETRPEAY